MATKIKDRRLHSKVAAPRQCANRKIEAEAGGRMDQVKRWEFDSTTLKAASDRASEDREIIRKALSKPSDSDYSSKGDSSFPSTNSHGKVE